MVKKVYVFLFNGFSDWEIAYLTPEIKKHEEFELIYFSIDGNSVMSMGGLQIMPDIAIKEIDINEVEMLILPGGEAWESDENDSIDSLIESLFAKGSTIAAICAATTYLGKKRILDELSHTSNDLNYLKAIATEYRGEGNYINEPAVTDQNVITANGTAPIEFSREIFKKLKLYSGSEIENWFQLFKNGVWNES